MNRGKKLILLLLVLALVIAAAVVVKKLVPQDTEEAPEEDALETVFGIAPESVKAVSWTGENGELSFTRTDDGWRYDGDERFPVSENAFGKITSQLANLQAYRTISGVTDLTQYGLTEPERTVSVTAGEEKTLLFGRETTTGGQRYLSLGGDTVYVVDASVMDTFSENVATFLQKEVLPDASTLRGFTAEGDGIAIHLDYEEESGRAYSDRYVWFYEDGGDYTALSTEETETFIRQYVSFLWGDCVSWYAEDVSAYGLTQPRAVTTVFYENEEGGEERFTLEFGDDDESGSTYCRIRGSKMVYLVKPDMMAGLTDFAPSEYLAKDILAMNWDRVESVDVTLDGKTVTMMRLMLTDSEQEAVWMVDGREADMESVMNGLSAMTSTGTPTGSSYGKEELISFTVRQMSKTFPEITLTFRTYDEENCVAERDGVKMLCPRSTVDTIVETTKERLGI